MKCTGVAASVLTIAAWPLAGQSALHIASRRGATELCAMLVGASRVTHATRRCLRMWWRSFVDAGCATSAALVPTPACRLPTCAGLCCSLQVPGQVRSSETRKGKHLPTLRQVTGIGTLRRR